ncbi:MAG TPA: rhodanese-like domain-containing protein [Usitatibacteraceae bacterium]|jgi:rhodanese-related sulfurtransferase|nr:rhodanese-like domain-containing protein [Usitatibacteraceae bacterium]
MKLRTLAALVAMGLAPAALAQAPAAAPAAKANIPRLCTNCHKPEAGEIYGNFEGVAFKSRSIQLKIDAATEIVRFDPKAIAVVDAGDAKPADHMPDVRKGHEARIAYVEKDGVRTATKIWFKGPIKIAPEKLVKYDEVAALVAKGPEAGNYLLVDSRPLPRVQEGTIPTAVNLPFTTKGFDALAAKSLPADKAKRVIFFCQGITCMLSPNSLRRAEAMGYTNVKVYREGWPEWTTKNVGVLAASHLKAAWIDKGIPHVLLDARSVAEMASGYIKGAVSVEPSRLAAAIGDLPAKGLKAPIMVYDGGDGKAAMKVAQAITQAGYPFVNVIPGGFGAWKSAGYETYVGPAGTRIAYVPRPRPGDIGIDAFKALAASTPADTLILDVRNQDEANAGMIKGAKLIPDEELLARFGELPKDKRIVAHCATGVRAEMAYHKLKEKGFNVAFVKGDIAIDKAGKLSIEPN